MEIRTVTVELLRAGPRHNQLVSPLTQYLAVYGNAPAGAVTLPFEQGELEMRLRELRYVVVDGEDKARSVKVLEKIGRDVADVLSKIPGVSGGVGPAREDPETLTHLRIVLSASELAMLPFEASKIPSGEGSTAAWLALQSRSPICITRHIRSVSAEGVVWPSKPRILFISGPDTPVAEHRKALMSAIEPWLKDESCIPEQLVGMENPGLAAITDELEAAAETGQPFTHVHILAHGSHLDDTDRYSPVGIFLNEDEGVIDGGRLASTLTVMTKNGVVRPVVVTMASCDSGQVADVRTSDASVAHHLHDQGIPLVVASQFPLSVEGSVLFTEKFYSGQLKGTHPLVSLYEVRTELHSRMDADTHDWASLVAYEAFPSKLASQLEDLRYWQARRVFYIMLERLEALADEFRHGGLSGSEKDDEARFAKAVEAADEATADLPEDGPYALDCAGLRGAADKRIGLASFAVATASGISEGWRERMLGDSRSRMESARTRYWYAAKWFMRQSTDIVQVKGNLHWMLGQVLSLDVVLGRPLDNGLLMAARFAANVDLDSQDELDRAWAHVSLCEQSLLCLADPELSPEQRKDYADESVRNARRFLELLGRRSEQVCNTLRQLERYIDWWGNAGFQPLLERLGVPERPCWHEESGLIPTAEAIVLLLGGPRRPTPGAAPAGKKAAKKPAKKPARKTAASAAPAIRTSKTLSGAPAAGSGDRPVFSVEMLPAENGDCLWIEYGDPEHPRRVLVDCGAASAAAMLDARIRQLGPGAEKHFELFVLTHIDADHINGVIPLFAEAEVSRQFKDIWFNGWRQVSSFLSVRQGEEFSRLLEDPERALPWNRMVTPDGARHPGPVVLPADGVPPSFALPGGLNLTLLSPGAKQLKALGRNWQKALLEIEPKKALLGRKTRPAPVTDFAGFDLAGLAAKPPKKDPSVPNGSSIALLLEFDGRAMLLTGDAHAEVMAKSINTLQGARGKAGERLRLDAFKLSHHGSGNATTIELLDLLDCPRYLVSSNGNIFYHPDREAIARVILHGGRKPTLCFNYRSTLNGFWDESALKKRYGYQTVYPPGKAEGLRVLL